MNYLSRIAHRASQKKIPPSSEGALLGKSHLLAFLAPLWLAQPARGGQGGFSRALNLGMVILLAMGNLTYAQAAFKNFRPVTEAVLKNPPPEDWPMYRRTYNNWGFSPLDKINTGNVRQLRLVWSRPMEPGWNEGSPLVRGGVMFIPNPGDVIQAVNAATGDLLWEYRRELLQRDLLMNPLGQIKRGLALYESKLITSTWDNHLIALEARSGKVVWDIDRGDNLEVSNISAPLVAGKVVIVGSHCLYSRFSCAISGHDVNSGDELWRLSPVPALGEKGDETWNQLPFENRWATGAWGPLSYDPELDLVYFGSTGSTPASPTARGTYAEGAITPGGLGSQLGTNTRFAIRPQTGQVIWRRQLIPSDSWGQDCTLEMLLVSSKFNPNKALQAVGAAKPGDTRKMLVGVPCKTGILWNLDARTGEFLYARSTVAQNLISKIDAKGLPTLNVAALLNETDTTYSVCPSVSGGKDWPPAAYYPPMNAILVPLNNACADMTPLPGEPSPENPYNASLTWKLAPGKKNMGRLEAISVETGQTLWSYEQSAPNLTPVLTTAGGLVFSGGQDSRFRAHDAKSGRILWATRLAASVSGHIISYGVNGRQYIAVIAGGGSAEAGLAGAVPGLEYRSGHNAIYVFALP